jgi:hypothetical protein
VATVAHGGVSDITTGTVRIEGLTALLRDAEAVGVAAADLKDLTSRLAAPIVALARDLAPKRSGKMARDIRAVRSKVAVRIVAGSRAAKPRVPYAAQRHWGNTGSGGPRFMSVAEERLRNQTFDGFAEGISQLLKDHDWT